ncbi:MAG: rRNA maturation RNase YbeY [Bacteroidetes bacterium]|nr:rRNA maturation RNase YbeY [Bacteroidota bacterium]
MGSVSVFNEHPDSPRVIKKELQNLAKTVFSGENTPVKYINIILTDAAFLLKMNTEFLNHDFDTDVITFSLQDSGPVEGEIYISLDQAKIQAGEFRVTFGNELNRLVIHGCLHLCGYDDATAGQQAEMRQKEDFYLAAGGSL